MLQQPSELIMYQKFPLDLNMHSAEVGNLQPDFKDISLQLQAQRAAAATQAFFLDAYSVKAAVPSPVSAATAMEALRPGIGIQGAYAYPFQAAYDPISLDRQHHLHHPHHQQQQKPHLHHHLQIQQHHLQQNHVPLAATPSTELWQQQQQRQQLEKRGCWFPNWQEVFDGFHATPKEEKQEDQQLKVHPNGGQAVDPKPTLSSPSNHDVPLPQAKVTELPHLDGADSGGLSDLLPFPSHLATAIVPFAVSSQDWRSETSLAPFADRRDPSFPPSAGDIACRYITQSPAWLPPGWITEVQTRRSGSTAGTRDKYYKDLVSGRRFRSRNEVIHYLQTGKGRYRSRQRRRAIGSSAFAGHVNYLTHQPHPSAQQETSSPCLFLTPEPIGFVLGPLVNAQSANSVPLVPPVVSHGGDTAYQTPGTNLNVSSTSGANPRPEERSPRVAMFGLKRPVETRPQKLPIHKKAKISSPNKCEDKQASRLWQWLHKPARADEQPQKQYAHAQKHVSMVEEKKAPDIEDVGRESPINQRTAQLSRDVNAAQRTITELGKEMQATIEKLTLSVQTAKRDLKLEADATHIAAYAMIGVMQATHRLDCAVGSLTEATQSLVTALGNAMHASLAPSFNVEGKQPQASAGVGVLQRALWPDVATVQSVSSSSVAHVPGKVDHAKENTMQTHTFHDGVNTYASQSLQGPEKRRACQSQSSDGYAYYALEPSHWLDNPGARITQATQLSDVFALYAAQQSPRPDLAMCDPTKIPQSSIIFGNNAATQATTSRIVDAIGVEKLSGYENAYHKASYVNTEARSLHIHRFPALNPKLDLSLLDPSLGSRQRAKEVQKMKAKHARGLLVILGRKLCYEAIHKSYLQCSPHWPLKKEGEALTRTVATDGLEQALASKEN
ncbi:hypothetical protein GOP47_0023796 [Adiantum capillus-veneris]|uniref:MBD domain-containing protein n=1 Tax=Adiantum capillus-veneris TaxID=13818 RepID=A0A9D4U6Q3_ADICA|nr:hypothetical protein GOP47_0023796 [Adiantum capillus-veneris]